MTDRYNALTVVLDKDTRSDDCEPLISAMRMLSGVCDVEPHVRSIAAATAGLRIRRELTTKIIDLIHQETT